MEIIGIYQGLPNIKSIGPDSKHMANDCSSFYMVDQWLVAIGFRQTLEFAMRHFASNNHANIIHWLSEEYFCMCARSRMLIEEIPFMNDA